MRKSHSQIQELTLARVTDFVNGDATESVLRASLKALGLDQDDIQLEVWKAKCALTQQNKPQPAKRSELLRARKRRPDTWVSG